MAASGHKTVSVFKRYNTVSKEVAGFGGGVTYQIFLAVI
jgi:hypothetical protein